MIPRPFVLRYTSVDSRITRYCTTCRSILMLVSLMRTNNDIIGTDPRTLLMGTGVKGHVTDRAQPSRTRCCRPPARSPAW